MDEKKTVVFNVLVRHRRTLYPRITSKVVFIDCKANESITGRKLKEHMASCLAASYQDFKVKFLIGCYNAILKKDGRRVVPVSPALFLFYDVNGQQFDCSEVCNVKFHELEDEQRLFISRKPHSTRFLTCDVTDVF